MAGGVDSEMSCPKPEESFLWLSGGVRQKKSGVSLSTPFARKLHKKIKTSITDFGPQSTFKLSKFPSSV